MACEHGPCPYGTRIVPPPVHFPYKYFPGLFWPKKPAAQPTKEKLDEAARQAEILKYQVLLKKMELTAHELLAVAPKVGLKGNVSVAINNTHSTNSTGTLRIGMKSFYSTHKLLKISFFVILLAVTFLLIGIKFWRQFSQKIVARF